ncbi:hypothetical protein ACFQNE_02900 [Gordonia phosphorivorans]|uniref:Molecular chaperone n=1 Tax=Gordonia phosphorivorans TaxID=1056982 RepID=A0ABV6H406_9ACTN
MSRTVLAIDIGSATITAAVAGGDNDQPQVLRPAQGECWPAAVHVDADGTLILDEARHRQAASTIPRVTRLLGREATIIGGTVRHADALLAAALTPVLTAATTTMRENIDLVVATYPSTWPEPVVGAFRHAITEFAPAEGLLIPWSDAVAAATFAPVPFVDCPITSIDFGARSASVTMARVDQQGRAKTEYTITNPEGGLRQIAAPIIAEVAQSLGRTLPGELEDAPWWDEACAAFGAARRDPGAAWSTGGALPAGSMVVAFPEPLGTLNLAFQEATDMLVEQLLLPQGQVRERVGFAPPPPQRAHLSLLDQLLRRTPVQGRWTVPGNPHAARPLVELTGGFGQDPAVVQAVREYTQSEAVVAELPAQVAAYGAAVLGERRQSRLIGARR